MLKNEIKWIWVCVCVCVQKMNNKSAVLNRLTANNNVQNNEPSKQYAHEEESELKIGTTLPIEFHC